MPLVFLMLEGEAACNTCGFHWYPGEYAYCEKDTDGSLLWYCDEVCVPANRQDNINDALLHSLYN